MCGCILGIAFPKGRGLCVEQVEISTLYTVTAFTVLPLPFKLCHERRSYLENLSMVLMKKSIDKNQG